MKKKETKLNKHAMRRILILVFCAFILTGVAVVMFHGYDPNQNNLGALGSVCMDIICILILIIVIGSFAFDNYGTQRTTRFFAALLIATIWAIFLDFLNWAFDGQLGFGQLNFWFTLGSLCMGAILSCIFSIYLYSYMEEAHNLKAMRLSAIICAWMNMVSFIVTFALAVSGTAFTFVDGHYETGALYDVVTVVPILTLLYLTGYAVFHVKQVGVHDVFAVAGYIFFMIAGALIESQYRIGTTYVAVAIADIFIFVMLQNTIIAREKRKVREWMEKSNTDELTGIPNRHAYEADLAALEGGEIAENFVYVSIDVNSLKTVNDAQGHNAGDELLKGASECLERSFGSYGKIYRMGGDEFIALLFVEEERLDTLREDIEKVTREWTGKLAQKLTLSCGYVSRREAGDLSIREMAVLADRRMYEAKSDYYRRNGIDRRKNAR